MKRGSHPIHIKFDTGMHRLGFDSNDVSKVIQMVQAQPEVYVKSVFSHLADASGVDKSFTNQQVEAFANIKKEFLSSQTGSILFHLLNTDGIMNFQKLSMIWFDWYWNVRNHLFKKESKQIGACFYMENKNLSNKK